MRKPYFSTKNLTVTLKFHCCVTILTLLLYNLLGNGAVVEVVEENGWINHKIWLVIWIVIYTLICVEGNQIQTSLRLFKVYNKVSLIVITFLLSQSTNYSKFPSHKSAQYMYVVHFIIQNTKINILYRRKLVWGVSK